VFHQLKKDIATMLALRSPYGGAIRKYLAGQIKR
jgi:coniferyl-aldehyde dehydrogenase